MSAPRVLHVEPGQGVAEVGTAILVFLQRIQTITTARALQAATRARTGRPRGSVVYLIEPFIGLPGSDVRSVMIDVAHESDRSYAALALIVEGGALQVAAARAFVIGLKLATSMQLPFELFPGVRPASLWLRRHDPGFPSDAAFADGVRALRQRVAAHR